MIEITDNVYTNKSSIKNIFNLDKPVSELDENDYENMKNFVNENHLGNWDKYLDELYDRGFFE